MKNMLGKKASPTGIVHVSNLSGHRRSYLALFSNMFQLIPQSGPIFGSKFISLCTTKKLIFATIDDDYFGFTMVSIIRALLGLRTVGIFLRPKQCFLDDKLIYKVKRLLFQGLVKLPGLTITSIIPHDLCPEYVKISNNWIHDPQLWDIDTGIVKPKRDAFSDLFIHDDKNVKVLSFIGTVNIIKGFMFLYSMVKYDPSLAKKIKIVVAGKVDVACQDAAEELKGYGVLIIDKYLTDEEINDLYNISNFIWCCYHPSYDQASGIYGRSFQNNKRPIVRNKSLISKYKKYTGTNDIVIEYGDDKAASELLINESQKKVNDDISSNRIVGEIIGQWKEESVKLIEGSL
ncbi:hypothetical protein [Cobetia sp. AM6]|uniref:hypothetical protein n=1 Tax=Cobetia sp. AM6 TaxID=2661553 RepID=UPI0012994EB5|nr:hypothetical protein [Cobetia sp. AM6]BBO56868.1 hypothetical protein CLAM6_21790 [Cobetia sp. AM6]